MSHTPKLRSGFVFKRFLNAIRPRYFGGDPPFSGFRSFFAYVAPSPPETVTGPPLDEKNTFLTFINPGYSVLDWESYSAGFQANPYPLPVDMPLNGVNMSMRNFDDGFGSPFYAPGVFFIVANVPGSERYNTTTGGTNFLQNMTTTELGGPDESFAASLNFDPPISCFGSYFTDLGDFSGQFILRLVKSDDTFTDFELDDGILQPGGVLTFWGFIDTENTYKQIKFFCSVGLAEGFGMDDLIFGPVSMINTTP